MWLKSKIYFILLFCYIDGKSLKNFNKLFERLKQELNFESILVLKDSKDLDCWLDLPQPIGGIFNFNELQSYPLKKKFNKRILAVVCLSDNEEKRNLELKETLYENLQDIRDTQTLVLTGSNVNLSALFQECRRHMMLNVLALRSAEDNFIYSFKAFPHFQVVERHLKDIQTFFEPQLRNLFGYTINSMPDNVLPRAVIYKDQVTGYLAYLFQSFARSLNASLQFCCLMQREVYDDETLSKLMENGTVDLSISLTSPSFDRFGIKNSKTVEISKWFVMLPVEPEVERFNLYFTRKDFPWLLLVSLLLALLLCNAQRLDENRRPTLLLLFKYLGDPVLRGMLSQSFILPSRLTGKRLFIYSLLLFSGLLLCNVFMARLDTYFIHPPTSKRIETYEDLRQADLKIFITQHDYDLLKETIDESILKKNLDIFAITDSVLYFQQMRNELNTTYAYSVTNTLWPMLILKQARLERPVFRESKSNEFTFLSHLLLALPLPRNSIYEHALNRFISLTHSSGLYTHWLERSFDDLIWIGKMSYARCENYQSYRDLKLKDFLWFWLLYAVGTFLSLLVFVAECRKGAEGRQSDKVTHFQ